MNYSRRSFFRVVGRAGGTAAGVLVGGAALWPAIQHRMAHVFKSGGAHTIEPMPFMRTGKSISGYNQNPPLASENSEDVASNMIRWEEVKKKIATQIRAVAQTLGT